MTETGIIKLSANENFYGCSEKVYKAIEQKYRSIYEYPEMNPVKLKEKIAGKHRVNLSNVIVGPGSVSIINHLIQSYSKPGDEILTFEKSFVAYGQLSLMHGRKCIFASLKDFRCSPENLLPFVNSNTKIIFIANPNNPTGTIISHDELESLLQRLSSDVLVVHDEAYGEYVHDKSFPDAVALLSKYPNLAILHSFSKIYGLAGLRAGYLIGNVSIISSLSKIHVPYSLNYLTSCAAIAALDDTEFLNMSAQANEKEATFLFEELSKLGYKTVRSHANFVYLWFESEEEKKTIYNNLLTGGIASCDLAIFGQEKSIRISIADRKTNSLIIQLMS